MPLVTNKGRAAAKRRAVKRAGGGNGSVGLKTTRLDPTRTVMMRKALTAELRRRFARLKALVVKLVVDEDAFGADAKRDPKYDTLNAFCPTGEGGGVDPTCSPVSSLTPIKVKGDDARAMDDYQDNSYDINGWLREGIGKAPESVQRQAMRFKKVFDKHAVTLKSDMVVYRGLDDHELPSADFQDKAFVSTSTDKEAAAFFGNTVMAITVPAGTKVLPVLRGGEKEVILPQWKFFKRGSEQGTIERQGRQSKVISYTANAFCPTGEGGGVDPSCSPGGGKNERDLGKDLTPAHVVDLLDSMMHWEEHKQFGLIPIHKVRDAIAELHGKEAASPKVLDALLKKMRWDRKLRLVALGDPEGVTPEQHGKSIPGEGETFFYISDVVTNSPTANAGRWRFESDREKVRLFAEWLKRQMGQIVAGKTARDILRRYALEGMKKGAGRAFDDVRKRERALTGDDKEKLDFYNGTRDQFLRESFRQPVSVQKVEALAGRSYDDLENITTDMSARMGRTLLDGLVQGKGAEDLATDLADQVNIGRTRAEVIARTEIIRAHAEGQLQAMEEMGVEEVGVAVEWVTAQDDKVCPKCESLEGVVLKISEAKGMLPRHPNCRCAWLPAGLGEDTTDQIDTKRGIRAALEEAGEDEDWGPDVAISRDRPEGIFNADEHLPLLNWCNQYGGDTCKDGSGFTPKERLEKAEKAITVAKGKSKFTKKDTKELTDALGKLTVKQLKDVQKQHGAKATGRKAELVKKLADKIKKDAEGTRQQELSKLDKSRQFSSDVEQARAAKIPEFKGSTDNKQLVRDDVTRYLAEVEKLGGSEVVLRQRAIEHLMDKHSTYVGTVAEHGMSKSDEDARALKIDGVSFQYNASTRDAAASTIEQTVGRVPNTLWRSTNNVIHTTQGNSDDRYWAEKYGRPGLVSLATGGDGNIVVYSGMALSTDTFSHESGHNLATRIFGNVTPDSNSAYGRAQAQERPVSSYGATDASEDFAEGCRLYSSSEGRSILRAHFPKKFDALEQLIGRMRT